jgi:asparagine synthase (glutamine-hydrolysing)
MLMKLFGVAGKWPHENAPALQAPIIHVEQSITVLLQGGPIWLTGSAHPASATDLIAAWRRQGPDFLAGLSGRFALALIDSDADRTLLAIDRMGIERLAFTTSGAGIAFSTSAEVLARLPGIDASLRRQALYDYLLLHMVPAPETAYEGVFKLRAGNCALFQNGRLSVRRYWDPVFASRTGSTDELGAGLHRALETAVEHCSPDSRTGSFLSGGLDSSTVTGVLARNHSKPTHSFSIGFGVDEFNELEYARLASRHFGTTSHEYDVTADDIVTAFVRIAGTYDEPFGNSSAVPTYFCAKLARDHGIDHLLAGDGGDEIFAGNERYARQRVFEAYWKLPHALRSGLVEPLTRPIDPESRVMPLRKLRSYVDQARIPLPERLESWNYMYRMDLGSMLCPDFRVAIDPRSPFRNMAEVYSQAPADHLAQRMMFYDWQYTLSDSDLRKVGTMCELAGVRVSYPMLDPAVIDLSLRVTPAQLMEGLELRSFYKRSMRGFLPEEILRKKKHGFGLPFGVWLKTHARLGELIYGMLGDFKRRQIVRPEFLDSLIAEHRHGHPGYYGYAIWDLAMLEAWLQAHPGLTLR